MNVQARLSLELLGPAIGAVIRGVDLAEPQSDSMIAGIRDALLRHQAIFFEDQTLTPAQQRDFAKRFGELHIHPLYPRSDDVPEIMVLDNHADNPTDNDAWHTDVTFIETPPMGSILYARQLPPTGGDTMWSSMTAAYDALSETFREFLRARTAVHDFARAFPRESQAGKAVSDDHYREARKNNPPVVHPVIRTHPETGRDGIFVNHGFTSKIEGLSGRESRAILGLLHEHIQRPEFVVRWRWKPNSIAFWDNRCTQHFAVNDYLPHRRVMHRATILGDRPYYRAAS
jgi:taurine dioxygenase